MKLNLMEIERFAIHDGPGIRSTVFLQGCPLHCPWCANPESQHIQPHLMYVAAKCVGCGACAPACKHGAIKMVQGKPVFDRTQCRMCKACGAACLQNAIRFVGKQMQVDEIVQTVLRDGDYYAQSGGGVTISGGEPFVQYEGFLALLRALRQAGISTAVETTGHVKPEHFLEAASDIDLFLFDLKHTNAEILQRETGANAALILQNLRNIAAQNPDKIILRVPVIPTFNFDAITLHSIFALAQELKIPEVHLLPYHTLGSVKYAQLGLDYPFAVDKMLDKAALVPYANEGKSMGLRIKIGG